MWDAAKAALKENYTNYTYTSKFYNKKISSEQPNITPQNLRERTS